MKGCGENGTGLEGQRSRREYKKGERKTGRIENIQNERGKGQKKAICAHDEIESERGRGWKQ